jgi:chemotaxis protein CheX
VDVNLINPVLEAFFDIIPQIGFQSVEKKSLRLKESYLLNPGVMISVGVMGNFKGAVLIGMGIDAAKQFASKMMMGAPVPELDAMAQSAIAEMGNMVCANSCMKFNQAGIQGLDISPPILLLGEGSKVTLSVPKVVQVTFLVDDISIDMFVGLNGLGKK